MKFSFRACDHASMAPGMRLFLRLKDFSVRIDRDGEKRSQKSA